jgi:hypothetical protein
MSASTFRKLIGGTSVQTTVVEASFESLPAIENYFYHTNGSTLPKFGEFVEIKLTIPPGNYEIEAIVRLFNNNKEKVHYGCYLHFFLDESSKTVWEGGEIGQSIHTTPHVVQFKVMSCFNKKKDIRFSIGTSADKAFIAENPCLMIRRIGSISFKAK